MKPSIVPGHIDLFKSECNNPADLIKNYSSREIIGYLSFINAQLFLNDDDDPKFQKEFTYKLASFWLPQFKTLFLNTISDFYISKNEENVNLFKTLYITYFIEITLKEYSSEVKKTLDSEGEYLILKAYFAYIDEFNKPFSFPSIDNTDPLKFQKRTWHFYIKQVEFNDKPDPIFQTIRLYALLEYFYITPKYKEYVDSYLAIYGRKKVWNLILDLMAVVQVSFGKIEQYDINNFTIQANPEFTSILDNLSIDPMEYRKTEKLHKDYLGMREKPLFKITQDVYVVMNWKFLYNSIYTGVLFDFKNKSGISDLIQYNTYKSLIGKEIAEDRLFKGILTYVFKNQHSVLHFGKSDKPGEPDAYLRIGKYILLFEFKDYLFPTEITVSDSFYKIKDHIDSNFIKSKSGQNKGINQIYNQVKKINEGGFDFDKYETKGIKKRNIVILPVIVTTHFTYQMPGINSYLSMNLYELFQKNEDIIKQVSKVYPLTVIDFTFIYRNFVRLKDGDINIKDLIINYQEKIAKAKKALKRDVTHLNALKYNASFLEHIPLSSPPQKDKSFVPALFEALDIDTERTNKI